GFFCNTEADFNDWCQQIKKLSLVRGALPMFELVERQPSHFSNPDVLNLTPGEATREGQLRVSPSLWLSANHVELHDDFWYVAVPTGI
ncbi:ATG4B protease, partial [Spizella passerina]|nr:ATG4B protease [Spizella passerina]